MSNFAKLILVLLFASSVFPAASTAGGNPFEDERFLRGMLSELGFFNTHTINIEIVGGVLNHGTVNINANLSKEAEAGLFLERGIIRLEPSHGQEQSHFVAFNADNEMGEVLAVLRSTGRNPVGRTGNTVSYVMYERSIFSNSELVWAYREWNEGNVAYAVVDGYYRVMNLFTAEYTDQLHEFKIVVEQNPASGNWEMSSYRGTASSLTSRDNQVVIDWVKDQEQRAENYYNRAVRDAERETERILSASEFSNYKRIGNILQITIENDQFLVNLDPILKPRHPDEAIETCEKSTTGGYRNWDLPEQWRVAQLLAGRYFDDWERPFHIKDTPAYSYWGNLINRSRPVSYITIYFHFLSRTVEDGNAYVVTYHFGSRAREDGDFEGGSLSVDSSSYMMDYMYTAAFCVNEDPQDNAAFSINIDKEENAAFLAGAPALTTSDTTARDLVINFDNLNPGPKKGFEDAVEAFKAANPDINVIVNNTDREAHKTAIRNFLTNDAPDVTSWYPGYRMALFVDAGLFTDISALWASDENLSSNFEAIKPTMTRDGKQWGVPYSYYQWGVYYRKDIFDKLSLAEPKTWDELLGACDVMKENGVTPFAIGTKFLWTAAGVFDYLNLRTNGYDVHNGLTAGEIKYTDDRIRATFANWETMLERCSFVNNHATMSWQEAIAPFANGDAAMYVMGNFAVDGFKNAGLSEDQIDFFRFPEITPGLARAEEAPADALFIPANAKNKEDARLFLSFVAQADTQSQWNKTIGQLPPNSSAAINEDDKFIVEGFATVSTAAGLGQFFDRDAPAAMAKAGMEGFQKFMLQPGSLDEILENLDEIQAEVYNAVNVSRTEPRVEEIFTSEQVTGEATDTRPGKVLATDGIIDDYLLLAEDDSESAEMRMKRCRLGTILLIEYRDSLTDDNKEFIRDQFLIDECFD